MAPRCLSVEEGLHESEDGASEDDFLLATVIAQQLDAMLQFQRGERESAFDLMTIAADSENSRALYYGPPHVPKPSNELAGEMLLMLDRPEEAVAYFNESLARSTGRTQSLLGLARAQEAIGDPKAAQTWQQLESNWRGDFADIRDLRYTWLGEAAD